MTGHMTPSDFLRSRGIDPRVVEERGLALALPEDAHVPPWARFGARGPKWVTAGYRLLLPLYDHHGEIRSARARYLGKRHPKSLAPDGHECTGLVMADALGLYLLKHGSRPEWWTPDAPPLRVVIAEGETDFLTFACEASDADEHAPAVLGVVNGSWTAELAARLPDGAHVIIATDNDDAGEKYAARIASTLAGRADLFRWRAAA